MPFECSVEGGVLVIRAVGILKVEDIKTLDDEEQRYFALPECRSIFLCDNSALKVISPEAANALVERMRVENPRIVRSAFVIGEGTAALQLSRMLRVAGSDKRRTFTDANQALAWLLRP